MSDQQPPSLSDVRDVLHGYYENESIPANERFDGLEELVRIAEDMLRRIAVTVVALCLLASTAHAQPVYFALQPAMHGSDPKVAPYGSRLIDLNEMNLPGVAGTTVRVRRQWANGGLTFTDQCRARVNQAGDVWTLLVVGGDTQQPWTEASLLGWERTILSYSARYAADTRLVAVHVTGGSPQGTSEELHWDKPISLAVENANKRLIGQWAAAFPRQSIILAISLKDPECMKRLIVHGLKVAPSRFLVKHNAMKAASELNAGQNNLVSWACSHGAMGGYEMVGSTLESRFIQSGNPLRNRPLELEFGGPSYGTNPTRWLQIALDKSRFVTGRGGKPLSYWGVYPPDLAKIGALK